MDHTVNVLDHGLVRLVSYTQPAVQEAPVTNAQGESIEFMRADYTDWTGDLEVVRNARVSYDAAWRAGDDAGADAKLINYLMKNQHWSPFESMNFTFEVKAPIFVLRQWHRHNSWRFSEVSARYSELPEEFYVPDPDKIGKQSATNKQMRTDEEHPLADLFVEDMRTHNEDAFRLYKKLLADGAPRELARTVLPLATYSHMFATVNLRNLMIFCALRLHSHAQYEIRVYAEAMLGLIEPINPVAVKAFRTHMLKEVSPVAVTVENNSGGPVNMTVTGVGGNTRKHTS